MEQLVEVRLPLKYKKPLIDDDWSSCESEESQEIREHLSWLDLENYRALEFTEIEEISGERWAIFLFLCNPTK